MSPVPEIVSQSPACAVCLEPATGFVNVTASAASSVPSVFEPRCDIHNPMSAAYREAAAEQRLRDAAPALRDALKAAQAVDDHEIDCVFCFHADPCGIRETLAADASAMRVAALAAAATPDAAEGGR